MNSIHQSLSTLLNNPALQGDQQGARKPAQGKSGSAPVTGETLKVSPSAQQALARANQSAALPALVDFDGAKDLTRLVRDALNSGVTGYADAHAPLNPRVVDSLIS